MYREEGVSGTKESADRPAWSELMTALYSNGVRAVIIEKLDRLARDLMVQETIVADLRKHGFELVSVAEPDLMANYPTRILVRQMMGAVARYEKSPIVLKLRGARMRKREREGRCEGRKPFGFYADQGAALKRFEALRAEGLGTRTGRQWHGLVIIRILTGKR